MIAGPNGSGKSTIKALLPPAILGIYVNPDEIEASIRMNGAIDLAAFEISSTTADVVSYMGASTLWASTGLTSPEGHVQVENTLLKFSDVPRTSYLASLTADFIRQKLLEARKSFTFETVMSHAGKLGLLRAAKQRGYRTYLYYIATEDPEINIARVKTRVKSGGHDVPPEKIAKRYYSSLNLLREAIQATNRAYVFDNSRDGSDSIHIAEITDGTDITIRYDPLPAWFVEYVWKHAT